MTISVDRERNAEEENVLSVKRSSTFGLSNFIQSEILFHKKAANPTSSLSNNQHHQGFNQETTDNSCPLFPCGFPVQFPEKSVKKAACHVGFSIVI